MLNLSSALSDVKVLDFSHLLAGPFATQTLVIMVQKFIRLNAFMLVMILDVGIFLIKKLVITLLLATWHGIEINDLLL